MSSACDKCSAPARGLFFSLRPQQVARLTAARVAHTYEPGQQLCFQGNPALAVYCVQQGRFKLSRLDRGGEEHVIGTRGAGDFIGHRAVLTAAPYRSTAQALGRSIACAIPRETFLELLRDSPELALALAVRMAGDSLASEELLMARSLERVRTRFARFLLAQLSARPREAGGPVIVPLSFKREEIARLIDTTPATLSRTLHVLTERGVLEPRGREIRVLDLAALERIARPASDSDARSPAAW